MFNIWTPTTSDALLNGCSSQSTFERVLTCQVNLEVYVFV